MELVCNDFSAHQCLYSMKAVGTREGPKESHLQRIQKLAEKIYVFGSKVPTKKTLCAKKTNSCNVIEPQYYTHLGAKTWN